LRPPAGRCRTSANPPDPDRLALEIAEDCKLLGGALETQTMSLFCPKASTLAEGTMVHALAHKWFGNDVSLENWRTGAFSLL
jgi:hypothetical protein